MPLIAPLSLWKITLLQIITLIGLKTTVLYHCCDKHQPVLAVTCPHLMVHSSLKVVFCQASAAWLTQGVHNCVTQMYLCRGVFTGLRLLWTSGLLGECSSFCCIHFTESQNGSGRKPLEVIFSKPPTQAQKPRAGSPGPSPGSFGRPPRKETCFYIKKKKNKINIQNEKIQ